jgi:hypothetical protein
MSGVKAIISVSRHCGKDYGGDVELRPFGRQRPI